jgi:hypothetical protein
MREASDSGPSDFLGTFWDDAQKAGRYIRAAFALSPIADLVAFILPINKFLE